MSADLQMRAEQAVEMLKSAGADDAWATAAQSRDVEFNYRDGGLEKVKDTTSRESTDDRHAFEPMPSLQDTRSRTRLDGSTF